jgi:hypothetical protein
MRQICHGLQFGIKRISEQVLFESSAVYLLNLLGSNAAEITCEGTRVFFFF